MVTTTEEYAMQERLIRVETKLDGLIDELRRGAVATEKQTDQHETRLRSAENTLTEIRTKVALMAVGTGGSAGIVTALITHFVGA